jgi:hypothetical protein
MLDELGSIWEKPITDWESVNETLSYFSASARLESYDEGDKEALQQLLKRLEVYQDSIVIKLFLDEDDSYEFSNRMTLDLFEERMQDFIKELELLDGEEELSVKLEINKKLESYSTNVLIDNIYSIGAWSHYLESLSIEELHHQFYKRYHKVGISSVVFLGDYSGAYNTDYFHFVPRSELSNYVFGAACSSKRVNELLSLRSNLGHFANAAEWLFIPEHFKFNGTVPDSLRLVKDIFNALHNVYLISFLANFTIVNNGKVEYTLKGLKDIVGEYDLISLKGKNTSSLWRLYQWIYHGSSVDKIGISRNIIPLHVDDLLSVSDEVLASAYSSFNLSQKDDVKSYIESINKLAEQVQTTSQKANEIAEKTANSIKAGIWGITTFAISTILFRIFAKGNEIETFPDFFAFIGSPLFVAIMFFALLIFSALFGLAWYESHRDQKRFKEMYESSKKVYQNVLTEDDIRNILSDDEHFLMNNAYISEKRKLYTLVWGGAVLVVVTILLVASCYANSNTSEPAKPQAHNEQIK